MNRQATETDLQDFNCLREQVRRIPVGSRPRSLWIGCTDTGMGLILERVAREMSALVLRKPGFAVPAGRPSIEQELSAVNFAVERLGIEEIVVCGHSLCTWCVNDLRGERPRPPSSNIEILRERMSQRQAANDLLRVRLVEQLDRLEEYPAVRKGIVEGTLHTHGLFYLAESGFFSLYDRQSGEFQGCYQSPGCE